MAAVTLTSADPVLVVLAAVCATGFVAMALLWACETARTRVALGHAVETEAVARRLVDERDKALDQLRARAWENEDLTVTLHQLQGMFEAIDVEGRTS